MDVDRKCSVLFIDDDFDRYISTIKLWTKIIVENHDVCDYTDDVFSEI